MKKSIIRFTSIITTFFIVTTFIFFIDNGEKPWKFFQRTTKKLTNIVNAQQVQNELDNWPNWPKSRKHKGFDGGWILPFEVFEQEYVRKQIYAYDNSEESGYKSNYAMPIDLNGDGLLDYIYSKANISYDVRYHYGNPETTNPNFYWDGVEQYIILNRGNGFELAYTCRQALENSTYYVNNSAYSVPTFWYYGNCADTSYTGGEYQNERAWSSHSLFNQESVNWSNNSTGVNWDKYFPPMGIKKSDIVYMDFKYSNPTYINSLYKQASIDRNIAKFQDVNGDGLPDIIFAGEATVSKDYEYGNGYSRTSISFVMLNNGAGFELEEACIQKRGQSVGAWSGGICK